MVHFVFLVFRLVIDFPPKLVQLKNYFLNQLLTLYFTQNVPQNAGNAILETHISNIFRGTMPPDPPRNVSSQNFD